MFRIWGEKKKIVGESCLNQSRVYAWCGPFESVWNIRPLAYEILLVSLAVLNMIFLELKINAWASIVQLRCMRSTTGHLLSVSSERDVQK